MEINVHDLIKIDSSESLIFLTEKPLWVDKAIQESPFVVVRRAEIKNNLIPIGIRGSERHERMPGFIFGEAIKELYTPEMIMNRYNEINQPVIMKETLEKIDRVMNKLNIKGGIIGSVAYEIITKQITINKKSDIDLIIRNNVSEKKLINLACKLKNLPIQVDILIETLNGGYNLKEFLSQENPNFLMRTIYGPCLLCKIEFPDF